MYFTKLLAQPQIKDCFLDSYHSIKATIDTQLKSFYQLLQVFVTWGYRGQPLNRLPPNVSILPFYCRFVLCLLVAHVSNIYSRCKNSLILCKTLIFLPDHLVVEWIQSECTGIQKMNESARFGLNQGTHFV